MSYRKNRVNTPPEATISRGKPASEMLSAGRRWQLPAIRLGLAVIAVPLALYDLGKPAWPGRGIFFRNRLPARVSLRDRCCPRWRQSALVLHPPAPALTAGLPTSAAAIRSLSVVPFVCLVPPCSKSASGPRSPLTGLIAALLVLLNTQIVSTAQSARSYAYVVLFVSLSFSLFSRSAASIAALSFPLAGCCHTGNILPPAECPIRGGTADVGASTAAPTAARRRLLPYLGTYLASCVPLLWLAHRRGAQLISWIPPLNFAEFRDLASFLFKGGGYGDPRLLLGLLTILACLAGTVHALQGWPQRDRLAGGAELVS